ncbi:hypothetical protein D3C75_1368190 [compost metagenome]
MPNQGYGVLRVTRVVQPSNVDKAKRQAEQQQITAALAQEEMQAYLDVLKEKAKVKILKPAVAKVDGAE